MVIGFALLLTGAVPVAITLLSSQLPKPDTFGPAGLTEDHGSREVTQFYYFWYVTSICFFAIGGWFFIAGLNDKCIISKPKPN